MLMLFGKLPWQARLLIGAVLVGFAVYQLAHHGSGVAIVVPGVAGLFLIVRGLMSQGSGKAVEDEERRRF